MSEHDQSQGTGRGPAHDETRAQAERQDRGRAEAGRGAGEQQRRGGGAGGGRRRHGGGQQQQGGRPARRAEASLNMEELRELAELFSSHGLTDFEFENEEIRVRLSRQAAAPQAAATHAPTAAPAPAPPVAPAPQTAPQASSSATPAAEEQKAEDLHIITSPIVGTFYRSPSPQAEPFVRVGSAVGHDTVVCIIEAMKLMNEIQAEAAGTVEKIYVENGQPVEYGQPLFGLKK